MPTTDGDRSVYLTFDDGPNPSTTDFILSELRKYNAKATFFMVGENVLKYPGLVEKIKEEGHSVGVHTMKHLRGVKSNTAGYIREVREEQLLLSGTRLFRPPHGIMRRAQYRELVKTYKIVMFDFVTMDFDDTMKSERIIGNLKKYVAPGSIIVFHDSNKARPRLLEALPQALEWLTQSGYECRRIQMD